MEEIIMMLCPYLNYIDILMLTKVSKSLRRTIPIYYLDFENIIAEKINNDDIFNYLRNEKIPIVGQYLITCLFNKENIPFPLTLMKESIAGNTPFLSYYSDGKMCISSMNGIKVHTSPITSYRLTDYDLIKKLDRFCVLMYDWNKLYIDEQDKLVRRQIDCNIFNIFASRYFLAKESKLSRNGFILNMS